MDITLNEILKTVKQRKGVDFSRYRRETIARGVANRMAALGCESAAAYLTHVGYEPRECEAFLAELAVNVSSFFRNPMVYEILGQRLIPGLLEEKRREGRREVRVWSAGCATGEEPYSVAILLHEAIQSDHSRWTVHVFATDINEAVLDYARRGIYPEERLQDAKMGIVRKYFSARPDGYEVAAEIRNYMVFSRDDLTSSALSAPADSVFGAFDFVLCRNVLIYMDSDLAGDIFRKLYRSLNPGGYLLLGEAETLTPELHGFFRPFDNWSRIYRRRI
jgi:chemotaxis protein methyltransferase CheR